MTPFSVAYGVMFSLCQEREDQPVTVLSLPVQTYVCILLYSMGLSPWGLCLMLQPWLEE